MISLDAKLRFQTCRLIEEMEKQPEHAKQLGLENVSAFRSRVYRGKAKIRQRKERGGP